MYAIWEKGDDIADGRIELTKKRFVYAGKPVKPAITVYDRSGKKVSAGKYTVTYEDNDGPGTGKIQVRGKEGKGGTLRMSFRINYDARSNVSSAKVTKKNVKVSYSKASYAAEYMVYAQNKTTGAKKSVLSKTTSATIKSLAKGSYEIYVIPYAKYGDGEGTYSSDRGAGKMKTVTIK